MCARIARTRRHKMNCRRCRQNLKESEKREHSFDDVINIAESIEVMATLNATALHLNNRLLSRVTLNWHRKITLSLVELAIIVNTE